MERKRIIVSHDDRGNVFIEIDGQAIVLTTVEALGLSLRLELEAADAEMDQ
jgi:hypothetical protein